MNKLERTDGVVMFYFTANAPRVTNARRVRVFICALHLLDSQISK